MFKIAKILERLSSCDVGKFHIDQESKMLGNMTNLMTNTMNNLELDHSLYGSAMKSEK